MGVLGLRVLAWSLPDVQPGPSGGELRGAQRGEAPGRWQLCASCDGVGVVADKFRRSQVCGECKGLGRFEVDSFTLRRVGSVAVSAPAPTRRHLCDRCGGSGVMPGRYLGESGMVRCEGCDGEGQIGVPLSLVLSRPAFRLDDSPLSRLRSAGDWDVLEGLLNRMRTESHGLFREYHALRVGKLLDDVRALESERWLLDQKPHWRVPAEVRTAHANAAKRAQLAERQRAGRVYRGGRRLTRARELARSGLTAAEIAASLGISVRSVSRALAA